jgi:hypothetical protein
VGYVPAAPLDALFINEVVPSQNAILADATQECAEPDPHCQFEDFIEIANASQQTVDLSGLWLSDRPFHPQGWQFPEGSSIGPGERLIVWTDNDGGKCPREEEDLPGDGQECPDPTDPTRGEYHTNFNLQASGDQVLLLEETENGFGVVHAAAFDRLAVNVSWSLIPDAAREGHFQPILGGSPGRENEVAEIGFIRGDSNGDCVVDLSDAIFYLSSFYAGAAPLPCPDAADADDTGELDLTDAIYSLNFQFMGGPRPPAPGPLTPGMDPTMDQLAPCQPSNCP